MNKYQLVLPLSIISLFLGFTNAFAQNSYTAIPTKKTIIPKTTIIESEPVQASLDGSQLSTGDGSLWTVFDSRDLKQPELSSNEQKPKFTFQKDGLKFVNYQTSKETLKYKMVVTLQKPIIYSAKQTVKNFTVRGLAPKNSQVLVYFFSDPKTFRTVADANGYFTLTTEASNIGVGKHIVTAIAVSNDALNQSEFVTEAGKVVEAQIKTQLTPGKVIEQKGDLPLIVAQPIAADPVIGIINPLTLNMLYAIIAIFFLIILILIWMVVRQVRISVEDYRNLRPAYN